MMRKTSVRSSGGNWILRIMRVWNKKTQKGRQIDLEVFSYILRNGVNICSYRERVMQKRLTPNDAETPEDWMKLAHAAKRRGGLPANPQTAVPRPLPRPRGGVAAPLSQKPPTCGGEGAPGTGRLSFFSLFSRVRLQCPHNYHVVFHAKTRYRSRNHDRPRLRPRPRHRPQ